MTKTKIASLLSVCAKMALRECVVSGPTYETASLVTRVTTIDNTPVGMHTGQVCNQLDQNEGVNSVAAISEKPF
jgi:hypothetical protein